MRRETADIQTDKQTDTETAVANIHFASATPHAKCNEVLTIYRYNDARIHQLAQPAWNFNTAALLSSTLL